MKLPYGEGMWFAVPLNNEGYAVGLIARMRKRGRILLCYFFGPKRSTIPELVELEHLKPQDAILVVRVGDLDLYEGKWPLIGRTPSWNRSEWPIPLFIRRELLIDKAWLVFYSDDDPSLVINEEDIDFENTMYEEDALLGAGAAVIELTRMLSQMPQKRQKRNKN